MLPQVLLSNLQQKGVAALSSHDALLNNIDAISLVQLQGRENKRSVSEQQFLQLIQSSGVSTDLHREHHLAARSAGCTFPALGTTVVEQGQMQRAHRVPWYYSHLACECYTNGHVPPLTFGQQSKFNTAYSKKQLLE